MEPIPEVRAGLEEFADLLETPEDFASQLEAVAVVAQGLVPSCLGVSLTWILGGDPFTITATSEQLAVVDAAQYLDGGPCLAAIDQRRVLDGDAVLDETYWQAFQPASTVAGVRATLSLPLRDTDGEISGALNLYAGEEAAFRGMESVLAAAFGARVEELVANADLSFRTLDWARELPERVRTKKSVEMAVGILMQLQRWTAVQARERLSDASTRAGVPVDKIARVILTLAP